MNRPYFVPAAQYYNNDFDFFLILRSYIKFSLAVLFFAVLFVILVWNMQPWFKIEIKRVFTRTANVQSFEQALQSNAITLATIQTPPG